MRSQLRFVMHPDDERDFISEVLHDDAVVLIDGPRWKSSEPKGHRSLESTGWYCIIWSKKDLPRLDSEFIPECNDWYCRSEGATIQFLRSRSNESVIVEGRLAISTSSERNDVAGAVEQRYRSLRTFVKKHIGMESCNGGTPMARRVRRWPVDLPIRAKPTMHFGSGQRRFIGCRKSRRSER